MARALAVALVIAAPAAVHAQIAADWAREVGKSGEAEPGTYYGAGVGTRLTYTDNVFRSVSEKDDFLLQGMVNGFVRRRDASTDLGVWAMTNGNLYADHDELNDAEFRALAAATWMGDRHTLDLRNTFRSESEPQEAVIVERRERMQNDAALRLAYDVSERVDVALRLYHTLTRFRESAFEAQDNSTYGVSAGTGVAISERVRARAEAEVNTIDYDQNVTQDSRGFSVRGGAGSDFSERLSGQALVGWQWREVDDDPVTGEGGTSSSLDFGVTLAWEPTETLQGALKAGRTSSFSLTGDFQFTTSVSISATQSLSEEVVARAFISFDHTDVEQGEEFDQVTLRLSAEWAFNPYLSLGGHYQFRKVFRDPDDFDENLITVAATYRF